MAVKEAKLFFIFKSPKAQGSRRKKERTEKTIFSGKGKREGKL